jgi:hypothetical protein
MILFDASLLIRAVRITLKNLCSAPIRKSTLLDRSCIHKFTTIVSKDHLERILEYACSAPFFQIVKGSPDFIAGFVFKKEKKHQLGSTGEEGKKNLSTLPAYYGIHFPDVKMRIFIKKRFEFQISPALSIRTIPRRGLFLPLPITDDPPEIKVLDRQDPGAHVTVKRALGARDTVPCSPVNMGNGLAAPNQWRYEIIQCDPVFLAEIDALSGRA